MSGIVVLFITLVSLSCHSNVVKAGFADDLLRKHNEFRAIHGAPQLAIEPQLTEKAQSLAQNAANNGKFSKAEAGINTYMACATYQRGLSGDEVTEAWYNGVCDDGFSFESPKNEKSNSFTQLVWKDTHFIGVGVSNATEKDNKGNFCKFVVVEYRPPGNVEEKSSDVQTFIDNVEKGRFDQKYCDKLNNNNNNNKRRKRSIYYRFPARFYIDPLTGQTKAVTPVDSFQANAKSQLPWYPSSTYTAPQYVGVAPQPMAASLRQPNVASSPYSSKSYRKSLATSTFTKRIEVGAKRNQVSNDALAVHNNLRRIHGSPDMTIDEGMVVEAEAVAKKNAQMGFLKHTSGLRGQGENLAFSCLPNNQIANIQDSVADWYKEVCNVNGYDFAMEPSSTLVLHFTQVVWKGSTKLGCGSATSRNGGLLCTYFCCRYKEEGNKIGSFKENVHKGSFNQNMCSNIEGLINSGTGTTPPMQSTAQPEPTVPITIDKPRPQLPTSSAGLELTTIDPKLPGVATTVDPIVQQQQDEKNYEEDAIKVMNKFRELHDTQPLIGDPDLHEEAKKMAVALVSSKRAWTKMKEKLKDRKEGIYQVSCNPDNKVIPPEEAMSNWYREACTKTIDFDLEKLKSVLRAPHFTQMIWKGSKKVGVAYATKMKPKKKSLCTVVVAKFDPPGNTDSKEYTDNVNTGSFDKSFCGSVHSIAISALDTGVQPTHPVVHPVLTPTETVMPPEVSPQTVTPTEPAVTPTEPVITPTEPVITPTVTQQPEPEPEATSVPETLAVTETPTQPIQPSTDDAYEAGKGSEEFDQQALHAHNMFRKIHGVPAMSIDAQMSADAAKYAQIIAQRGGLSHSSRKERNGDGENLAMKCSSGEFKYTGDLPVAAWYEEVCDPGYKFNPPQGFSGGTGHFTQVVWKESIKLGVGVATANTRGMKCFYTVGRYRIAGNMGGAYVKNVPQGVFTREKVCPSVGTIAKQGFSGSPGSNPAPTSSAGGSSTDTNSPAGGVTTDVNPPGGGTLTDQNPPASGTTTDVNPATDENKETVKNLGQDFNSQALNAHNKFRTLHKAPPMTLDATMTQEAAAYARKIANLGSLQHAKGGSPDNPKNDGENLAYMCSSDLNSYTGDKPVSAWYEEVCKPGYIFNPPQGFSGGTGHFTQVVWKDSTLLGFGKAESKKGSMTCVYSVGRYRKPGNFGNRFGENVLQGGFSNYYCKAGKIEEILSSKRSLPSDNSTIILR